MSSENQLIRVFVASTYLDNTERREAVRRAITRAKMQPVGMEFFAASTLPTVDECLAQVATCDVFIGIVGNRYGFIPDSYDKSITELEYDHHSDRLMFVIDDSVERNEADLDGPVTDPSVLMKLQKLVEFKQRISAETTPRPFGKDLSELELQVYQALVEWRDRAVVQEAPPPASTPDKIVIPDRLREKIEPTGRAKELAAIVESVSEELSTRAVFFEETGTCVEYINGRLRAADALIPNESLAIMNTEDALALLTAIVLYCSAVSIDPFDFHRLTHTESQPNDLSVVNWNLEWEAFQAEASRYDGRKLRKLFGDPSPVDIPGDDPSRYDANDVILIKEFLKSRLPKIAAEISRGAEGRIPREFTSKFDKSTLECAAIIVSGANGSIRRALEENPTLRLNDTAKREYRHVHVPYIISVMRLSLFLAVDEDRQRDEPLKVRRLIPPIGLIVDDADLANLEMDLSRHYDDPEALFATTLPTSSRQFCAIQDLLEFLQSELDRCWAILGEIYGRYEPVKDLSLAIRRIRSNLDNLAEFEKTAAYVPSAVQFESAGVDLLKLLIGPLYGNFPQVGIRELVQNAVDAVRERSFREGDHSAIKNDGKPDVVVELQIDEDEERGTLSIRDRGIGMNSEIIQNYFLRAGASYRRSDAWRDAYEADGRSQVLRSGRFGVGVLAAFLLGNRIKVRTRHFRETETRGIEFECSIDDDQIELKKVRCDAGTEITVELTDPRIIRCFRSPPGYQGTMRHKQWDWYGLAWPKVERISGGDQLEQTMKIPGPNAKLPEGWHRIQSGDFDDIQWTSQITHNLLCNGIVIANDPSRTTQHFKPMNLILLQMLPPAISVFDPDGRLPLNLQRSEVARNGLPFVESIHSSVVAAAIESLAKFCLDYPVDAQGFRRALRHFRIPGLRPLHHDSPDGTWSLCGFDRDGIAFVEPGLMSNFRPDQLMFVPCDEADRVSTKALLDLTDAAIVPVFWKDDVSNWTTFGKYTGRWQQTGSALSAAGYKILYDSRRIEVAGRMAGKKQRQQVEELGQSINEVAFGKSPPPTPDINRLRNVFSEMKHPIILLWSIDKPQKKNMNRFVRIWDELLDGGTIPFDRKQLRELRDRVREYKNGL